MAARLDNPKVKFVLTASAPPEECFRRAQVLVVGDHSWHVIGPAPYRLHVLNTFSRPPAVGCAVVDVRGVTDDEGMGRVVRACTDPSAGVINMDGLLTGLAALGGKVTRVSGVKCQVSSVKRQVSGAKKRKERVQ